MSFQKSRMDRALENLRRGSLKEIDISRVGLKTCTVSVEVVKLDNRQMTLSVFRQLVELPYAYFYNCEEDEYNLWGTVNYWPEKIHKQESFLFVIFETKGRLRRCAIPMPGYFEEVLQAKLSCGHLTEDETEQWYDWYDEFMQHDVAPLDQLFIAT